LSLVDRESIGTVLAESFFNDIYTIKDLNRLLKNFYRTFDESYFQRKCADFHLPQDQRLKEFSTGMKAKLKTLTALSHEAQLNPPADSMSARAMKFWTYCRTTSSTTRNAAS
jgi:ABC-2 type transport system ATP-binding protein